MKDPKRVKQGRKNRASGRAFELKVRHDLEDKGWIVCKWQNQIVDDKIVSCKPKYNPFTKSMMMITGGFPDFIVYALEEHEWSQKYSLPRMVGGFVEPNTKGEIPLVNFKLAGIVFGVEAKSNGYLSIEEKDKCEWLLEHKIFSKILIAKKGEKRGQIIYEEFKQ